MSNTTYKVSQFPNEELVQFQSELQALLDKWNAILEPEPQFMKNTIKGPEGQTLGVWSQVMKFVVYKKTPENGVPSPFTNETPKTD